MKKFSCYILMASNYDAPSKMELALKCMNLCFPGIQWDTIRSTQAHDMKCNLHPFLNQVGYLSTTLPKEKLIQRFKKIEKQLGRNELDEKKERICIDIDLLSYNNDILKLSDWNFDYVQESIQNLKEKNISFNQTLKYSTTN